MAPGSSSFQLLLSMFFIPAAVVAFRTGSDHVFALALFITMMSGMILCAIRINRLPFVGLKENSDNTDVGAASKMQKFLSKALTLAYLMSTVFGLCALVVDRFRHSKMLDMEQVEVWLVIGSLGFFGLGVAVMSIAVLARESLVFVVSGMFISAVLFLGTYILTFRAATVEEQRSSV